MSETYSESCSIEIDSRVRGVKRVVNEVADDLGISVSIDTDTYCNGGFFFKTYTTEYNIRFRGEKEKVKKAIKILEHKCEDFNDEIQLPVTATTGF